MSDWRDEEGLAGLGAVDEGTAAALLRAVLAVGAAALALVALAYWAFS